MAVLRRLLLPLLCLVLLAIPRFGWGQEQQETTDQRSPGPNQPLPRSNGPEPAHGTNESSSRDTILDLSPPANDAKDHPNSVGEMEDEGTVHEFHPYDPHRAMKDVEVGDFYFERHNYPAAISRYREALLYKPDDASATWGLAQALDKAGKTEEARANYESYLKILPYGPKAAEAHQALERLKPESPAQQPLTSSAKPNSQQK